MNFLLGTGGPVRPNLPPHLMDEGERAAALVEKATSDILLQVDWAAMMEVVDAINTASDQAVKREIVRQIRKRLQSRSTRVVHMALELSEAVVKNGNESVHREVATPKFMNTMARVARAYAERSGKENLEVADKALELIQSWGETFLPQSHSMPLFAETYHVLRREGLPFRTQYDETKVPVLTPPPSAPSMRGGSGQAAFGFDSAAGGSLDLSESSLGDGGSEAGLPPTELVTRAGASEGMLSEILQAAGTREELMANAALPQVLAQCQRLARALQQGIEARVAAGSAEMLEEYFAANDALQSALQLYSGIKDRKVVMPLPGPARGPPAQPEKEEDLDDFLSMSSSAAPATATAAGGGGKAGAPSPVPPFGSSGGRSTPGAEVPRLAPSRRDSFDKDKNRQSFRRRSGSGGGGGQPSGGLSSDFLHDVASLDISGTSAGTGVGTGVFASNASSITDAPEFRTTGGSAAPPALHADPFASAPPVPILPPPRSIASPSITATTTTTTTTSFPSPPAPAAAFLSAPGNMTAAASAVAFPAFPQQQQQQMPMPMPAYGSMGGGGGSISSSMGASYQSQQQPPQQQAQWGAADPFAEPPAQQGPMGGGTQQQPLQVQPARPVSYPQPTTATGGPAGAGSQNPFDLF